jgi:LPS-assembly protein
VFAGRLLPETALKPANTDKHRSPAIKALINAFFDSGPLQDHQQRASGQRSPQRRDAGFFFEPTPLVRSLQGALSVLALGGGYLPQALAQSGDEPGAPAAVRLQASPLMKEKLSKEAEDLAPSFVYGEKLEGQTDGVTVLEGSAELRRHDTVIRADRLEFDRRTNDAKASGNVLINRGGDRFEGPELQINTTTKEGYFEQPTFSLPRTNGFGDAKRVDFLADDKLLAHEARYSTCPRTPGVTWAPDWLVRASKIELDNVEEVGTATGGVLEFKGVPFLAAPYLSFPLTDKRKSGALPPSLSIDSQSGVQVTTPYYLNLAPNFDATLSPTVMSKRGVDLAGEFRYLQPTYTGQLRAAYMPSDRLRDDDRWAYSVQHGQQFPLGFTSPIGMRVNLNRVSDNNYWRDFPRTGTSLLSRLLPNDVALGWANGPWAVSAGAYTWQALQDEDSRFTPPYDRLPSLGLTYQRSNETIAGLSGWDWSIQNNVTRFQRSIEATATTAEIKSSGDRALTVAEITRRWQTPGWFIQPKARLHATSYQFDTAINGRTSASRVLPTFSVDNGLIFERPASFFGRSFIQTLEPRAFFTWTPYRDQSDLPVFDSAARNFNLSTLFTENTLGGNDRITDTRAITLGVNTRLFDPDKGGEIIRLGVAQRYFLADQNVTLPGRDPVTERISDVLFAARVQWDKRWSTDLNLQYNPKSQDVVRTTVGARFNPSDYRTLSVAYRQLNGASEQLDVGWQWPLSGWGSAPREPIPGQALGPGQWYTVGRINYSVPDKKVVDLVAGFEYDAGCWLGRVVVERLQLSRSTSNQRILFQLEFTGFSRVGANSLQSLQTQVPRYRYLREEINPPSRFQNYD